MEDQSKYDISIIRPQVGNDDIQLRGEGMPKTRLKQMKTGLHALHALELMAVNIYKFQLTSRKSELNHQLIAAMCNEMTHVQDFQVRLYEFGFRPGRLRWVQYWTGIFVGLFSRLLGIKFILKADIWLETKAVKGYGELLDKTDWDKGTRNVIEKNQADEVGHINRWKKLLKELA